MCPDTELLSAYFDDELPLSEQQAIRQHVEDCLVCQVLYRNMATVSQTCQGFSAPPVSENFMAQLLAQLPPAVVHPTAEALSAYYDHALTTAEQPQIAEHLQTCEACQHIVQLYSQLSHQIQTLPVPTASADFMSTLMAQLEPVHPTLDMLSAFYDQQLEGPYADEVAGHVAECTVCERSLQQLTQVQYSLQQLPVPVASASFIDHLFSRIDAVEKAAWHPAPEMLSGYHDDALAPAELKTVAMHMANCSECQQQLQQLQQLTTSMAALPVAVTASPDFMSQLLAKVEAAQHPTVEVLSAYYDEVLDFAERPAVKAHVANCSACQTQLANFNQLGSALQALPQPVVSIDFLSHLESQLPTPTVAPTVKILSFGAVLRSRYSRMVAGIVAFGLLATVAIQTMGPEPNDIAEKNLTERILPVQYRSEDELFVSDMDTFSLENLENPVQDDYTKLLGGQS